MSTYTSINPATLRRAAADVQQLTQPIHVAIRGKIVTHPCLLDQLRDAAQPGTTVRGPERRSVPRSQPPANLDTLDALSTLYVELSGWHARLRLTSPPRDTDWQKTVLRALVGAMPNLAGEVAEWLGVEIHDWWRAAATHAGWRPTDLLKLR